MKKLIYTILTIALLSPLAACATTGTSPNAPVIITKDVNHVIEPPATLFYCPQLSKLPNPSTLTNRDLANLITTLMKNNQTCGYNMIAIENYIKRAKAAIETENKSTQK